jgi:hypothetical protein
MCPCEHFSAHDYFCILHISALTLAVLCRTYYLLPECERADGSFHTLHMSKPSLLELLLALLVEMALLTASLLLAELVLM